ncbi:MAG: class SAM-dependent methyltransferase [Actinomycetia bacterium]|nr:class SAM-dependent methyltransferase [Actinomycetes bacterium]
MAVPSPTWYDDAFYGSQAAGSRQSAKAVIPIVNEMMQPASVLDVGCGVGTWLAEWVSQGVSDVVGLDGDYVKQSSLQIPADKFIPTNLQKGFTLGRKFDLVSSLEVAEHLDAVYTDRFVESLTSHGDVILFSAAIPGQGGEHHVNEQWPPYWIEKFSRAGFKVFDAIRPQIWGNADIEPWYRQNIFIFSNGRVFDTPDWGLVNVVHPDMWKFGIDYEMHPHQLLSSLPGALSQVLRNKLGMSPRK